MSYGVRSKRLLAFIDANKENHGLEDVRKLVRLYPDYCAREEVLCDSVNDLKKYMGFYENVRDMGAEYDARPSISTIGLTKNFFKEYFLIGKARGTGGEVALNLVKPEWHLWPQLLSAGEAAHGGAQKIFTIVFLYIFFISI